MSSFATISSNLTSGPSTSGFDAVLQVSEAQLNAVLFQQYLSGNYSTTVRSLNLLVPTDDTGDFTVLNVEVGPPQLSFTETNSVQLTMYVTGGGGMTFNNNAATLTPEQGPSFSSGVSTITAVIPLSQVTGTVVTSGNIGTITLELNSPTNSWTFNVAGLNGTQEEALISAALSTYFQGVQFQYELGSVTTSGVQPYLEPTSFVFTSSAQTGCLTVGITTNGTPGEFNEVQNLIPDGYSATLLLSNRVMFNEFIPDMLNTPSNNIFSFYDQNGNPLTPAEAVFAGTPNNSTKVYSTVGTGTANWGFGPIASNASNYDGNYNNSDGNPITASCPMSNADTGSFVTPTPLPIPLSSLTLTPNGNSTTPSLAQGLGLSWNVSNWTTGWENSLLSSSDYAYINFTTQFSATGVFGLTLKADAANQIVLSSTAQTVSATLGSEQNDVIHKIFSYFSQNDVITSEFSSSLTASLSAFPFTGLNVFCLSNILFPSTCQLNLSEVSLPCDLYAVGNLITPVTISPGSSNVESGGAAITLTASCPASSSLAWSATPSIGTLTPGTGAASNTATYTPPTGSNAPSSIILVQVVDTNNPSTVAYAVINLETNESTNLTISPPSLLCPLPSGSTPSIPLGLTNQTGNTPIFTVTPGGAGTVEPSRGGGYFFTPTADAITQATTVTIEVAADGETAAAVLNYLPIDTTLAINAANTASGPQVQNGFSLTLTSGEAIGLLASATNANSFNWALSPNQGTSGNCGTLTFPSTGDGNNASVTYTAPTVSAQTTIILACFCSTGSLAIDTLTITVNPV